ncbi:MAG: hypothetical protein QGD94_06305 [Planctomycetia bacterium]|nr:hypothetical protein [Planctomycetia bacterium]
MKQAAKSTRLGRAIEGLARRELVPSVSLPAAPFFSWWSEEFLRKLHRGGYKQMKERFRPHHRA